MKKNKSENINALLERLKSLAFAFVSPVEAKEYFSPAEISEVEAQTGESFTQNYKRYFLDAKLNYKNLILRSAIEGKAKSVSIVQSELKKIQIALNSGEKGV